MTEKTWTITYIDDTPSLKVEAESLVKAVEKVKDKLSYADLKGVSLNYADLRGADLHEANLESAKLNATYLNGADLHEANLNGASLREADLEGADLREADLSWASLKGARLNNAQLSGTNLEYAYLGGADLKEADLDHANLRDANLSGADLSWADLEGADFKGADLSRANLSRADLSGAALSGAEGLPPYVANRNNMGYYEINVVSEKLVGGYCFMCHSYSYSTNIITKKAIEFVWQYISNDKLMAAKQKLSLTSCFICMNGKPRTPKVTTADKKVKTLFESYCLLFKPKHKYMQIILTTARGRKITVCITYRKEN